MPTIDENQKFKRKVIRDFLDEQQVIEGELLQQILDRIDELDTVGGNFSPGDSANELLASIRQLVRSVLAESGYDESIDDLVGSFDEIEDNLISIHQDLNDIDVDRDLISADKANAVELTVQNLKEANIDLRFIQPVQKLLFAQVNLGANVTDTKNMLREMILSKEGDAGVLTQWVGQVARDAVYQYQGSVNATIKERFELNAVRYVGTIQPNTRPQCRRWVEMEVITDEQLAEEIQRAFNSGSGMIPGTTPDNFTIFRGGYNCAHEAYPTRA